MLLSFVLSILVLGISLLIISKLPLGIDIDSAGNAFAGGAVIGFLNALGGLIPSGITSFFALISLGVIPILSATIVFGLAAALIDGVRLKWGIGSALLGAIALAIVNGILRGILGAVGLI